MRLDANNFSFFYVWVFFFWTKHGHGDSRARHLECLHGQQTSISIFFVFFPSLPSFTKKSVFILQNGKEFFIHLSCLFLFNLMYPFVFKIHEKQR